MLVIADLRGGRNGADPPISLPDDQAVEALNVDWYDGLLARKRGGAAAVTDTGGTAFSSGMQTLIRHVPGADETAAELWGVDGAPIVKRMTGGTSYANVTLDDAIGTRPQDVVGASLNGKLFLAYDSSVDRLHVYDPSLSSPRVRRVSLPTPGSAPTAANSGSGSYPATKRYYRVRWLQWDGASKVIRRSEPSASVSITPSGSGQQVDVTRPSAPGEGETHWELEVSLDDNVYYVIYGIGGQPGGTPTAIGTTVAGDAVSTTIYSAARLSEPVGFYGLFPSVKYLLTDGNRLLGGGAWESSGATSGGKNSRVWFTPVLGSADEGDDERVPNQTTQKNWVDLNENDGGGITGFGGPINGVPYVGKYRQIYRLTPTGDVSVPYLPRRISDVYGFLNHKSTFVGRDAVGNPALYFLSPDGPCRIVGLNGVATVQYLGRDVEDLWATINRGASTVVAHGLYHPDKHQVWWWIATGSSDDPDTKLCFDVLLGKFLDGARVRGGWAKHTGPSAGARCSCLMSNTLGASMSRDLKPYIGRATGTAVWKCDTADLDDAGTAFQAYVKTKPIAIATLGMNVGVGQTHLLARAASGVTITQTIDRDYGLETRTATCLLTAAGSETRVLRQIEGSDMSQAGTLQFQWGDATAVANSWTLEAASLPVHVEDRR